MNNEIEKIKKKAFHFLDHTKRGRHISLTDDEVNVLLENIDNAKNTQFQKVLYFIKENNKNIAGVYSVIDEISDAGEMRMLLNVDKNVENLIFNSKTLSPFIMDFYDYEKGLKETIDKRKIQLGNKVKTYHVDANEVIDVCLDIQNSELNNISNLKHTVEVSTKEVNNIKNLSSAIIDKYQNDLSENSIFLLEKIRDYPDMKIWEEIKNSLDTKRRTFKI